MPGEQSLPYHYLYREIRPVNAFWPVIQAAVTYDWRLAVPNLEIRDHYFSRLRNTVEQFKLFHNEKVPPFYPEEAKQSKHWSFLLAWLCRLWLSLFRNKILTSMQSSVGLDIAFTFVIRVAV